MLRQVRMNQYGRQPVQRRRWLSFLLAIAILLLPWASAAASSPVGAEASKLHSNPENQADGFCANPSYPATAGMDEFDSSATVIVALSGFLPLKVDLAGPTRVQRGVPFDPGDGKWEIDTEIVSLELHGTTVIGPVSVRESAVRQSSGNVKQQMAGVDFPSDSFFDIFVEIDTPLGLLHNNDPIRLSTVIECMPPWQAQYTPPTVISTALYNRSGFKVGVITHASHFVGQKPSFSLDRDPASPFDPATILDVPTASRILPAGLGLTIDDNLDALSYGEDYIWFNSDLRFSVDPAAIGVVASAVNSEATKSPNEAHADEFAVWPPLPGGGSNVQILDETGDTAPPFPLVLSVPISDDVDALTEPPAAYVDPNEDGVPDSPVYFSLDPGSPTLGTIPASPADILMSVGGAAPTVYLLESALGLIPGDDVDAICLEDTSDSVLFSLAPGSPTLGLAGAGPADLFWVFAAGPPIPTPLVFVPAASLGLLADDNLDALKCTLPEVDYFPFSLAEIDLQIGLLSETVKLSGPATVKVAISPDGAALDSDKDNRDQVQTEIV